MLGLRLESGIGLGSGTAYHDNTGPTMATATGPGRPVKAATGFPGPVVAAIIVPPDQLGSAWTVYSMRVLC